MEMKSTERLGVHSPLNLGVEITMQRSIKIIDHWLFTRLNLGMT